MRKVNRLREIRRNHRPQLSIVDVARFYRGGVSKQRICQIENADIVSAKVERDYRVAIVTAVDHLKQSLRIMESARNLATTQ